MTSQEIDRIQNAIRHIQTAVDVDEWAKEIVVDAMWKQIQRKPEYKEEDRFIKNLFTWYWYCPQCGCEINTGDMHCTQCGQAIDWSDEDD